MYCRHSDESVPAILAGPCILEAVASHRRQAEHIVESPVTTAPRNWSINLRSKSNLRISPVDSPAGLPLPLFQTKHNLLIIIAGSRKSRNKSSPHPANAG
jgi:hypothetical protein